MKPAILNEIEGKFRTSPRPSWVHYALDLVTSSYWALDRSADCLGRGPIPRCWVEAVRDSRRPAYGGPSLTFGQLAWLEPNHQPVTTTSPDEVTCPACIEAMAKDVAESLVRRCHVCGSDIRIGNATQVRCPSCLTMNHWR